MMKKSTQKALMTIANAIASQDARGEFHRLRDGTGGTEDPVSETAWSEKLRAEVTAVLGEEPDSPQLEHRLVQAAVLLIGWVEDIQRRGQEREANATGPLKGTVLEVRVPGRSLLYRATVVGPDQLRIPALGQVVSFAEVQVQGVARPKKRASFTEQPLLDLINGSLDSLRGSDN